MKLFSKRIFAAFIDYFVIASILFFCSASNFSSWVWSFSIAINDISVISFPSFGFLIVIIPLFFKDVLFRNASLGKKLMGLVILSEDGVSPPIKVIVKRGIIMATIGYINAIKFMLLLDYSAFVDWELSHLKTKVVDRRRLQR